MNALVECSQNWRLCLLKDLQQLFHLSIVRLVLPPTCSDTLRRQMCAATAAETHLELFLVLFGSCVDLVVEEHDANALCV